MVRAPKYSLMPHLIKNPATGHLVRLLQADGGHLANGCHEFGDGVPCSDCLPPYNTPSATITTDAAGQCDTLVAGVYTFTSSGTAGTCCWWKWHIDGGPGLYVEYIVATDVWNAGLNYASAAVLYANPPVAAAVTSCNSESPYPIGPMPGLICTPEGALSGAFTLAGQALAGNDCTGFTATIMIA